MKIANASPEFKTAYDKRYKQLKSVGFGQPHLSSLAKKYATLDLEVQERKIWYSKHKYIMKINADLFSLN